MTYIPEERHRRWAEEGTTHQGAPGLPGVPRWVVVGPLWYLFAPIFLIYSIKISMKFQLIWSCAE